MAATRLAINGKFLSAPPTGVHRVAAELANALGEIAAERPGELDIELWLPRDGLEGAGAIRLPARTIAPLTGIPWEQLVLPWQKRDRLLLNLCNIGPVARDHAMTMIHDAQVRLTPQSYSLPFRLWYRAVQPLLGRRNRRILTVSEYSRKQIADAGVCAIDHIIVVPNGVDHMLRVAGEPGVVDRLGLTGRRFVVAFSSTRAHKNIALLARIFAALELADIRLLLIGDDRREDFAAQGISFSANVTFAGRIADAELRSLYEAALCMAFPSRTEGFGLPPLEAMLLGCPAVVAPCGALPEMCGGAALYGDPDRPLEWIAHIRTLADDDAFRERQRDAGRIRARHFTWRAAAERLLDAVRAAGLAPASHAAPHIARRESMR